MNPDRSMRARNVRNQTRNQQEPLNQRRGLIVIGSEDVDNINRLIYSGVSADTRGSSVSSGVSADTKTYSMRFESHTIKHRNKLKRKRHKYNSTILDSGATGHIFSEKKYFLNTSKLHNKITVGDGSIVSAIGHGDIKLTKTVCLKNVLLSPGMRINVVSVSQLISDGC